MCDQKLRDKGQGNARYGYLLIKFMLSLPAINVYLANSKVMCTHQAGHFYFHKAVWFFPLQPAVPISTFVFFIQYSQMQSFEFEIISSSSQWMQPYARGG